MLLKDRLKSAAARESDSKASYTINCSNLSDEEVFELSLSLPRVFMVIVERYQSGFLRSAYRVVRSKEEAEDITQEAFIKIYKKASGFKKRSNAGFRNWAYTVLLNTARSHYRKLKKQEVPIEEFFDLLLFEGTIIAQRQAEKDLERRELVQQILEDLPEGLSHILRMHYFEGWSYKDISEKFGVPVSTIKMRLYQARQAFKKIFLATNQ